MLSECAQKEGGRERAALFPRTFIRARAPSPSIFIYQFSELRRPFPIAQRPFERTDGRRGRTDDADGRTRRPNERSAAVRTGPHISIRDDLLLQKRNFLKKCGSAAAGSSPHVVRTPSNIFPNMKLVVERIHHVDLFYLYDLIRSWRRG